MTPLDFFKSQIGKDLSLSPSPMGRWLNGSLLAAERGSLRIKFVVRPEMTNPAQILQGGMMAAMLDEVIGMTIATLDKTNFFSTVNLAIDYLSAARVGEEVIAESRLVREGRQILYFEGKLTKASDDKLIAQCTTNLVITGIEWKPTQGVS